MLSTLPSNSHSEQLQFLDPVVSSEIQVVKMKVVRPLHCRGFEESLNMLRDLDVIAIAFIHLDSAMLLQLKHSDIQSISRSC